MRDTGNQVVLGTFTATFLYCLLILLSVREGENEFVPRLSIAVAIILAVLSLVVLIYFIHHSSASIQADNLIARVSGDMERSIDKLFPEQIGSEPDEQASEQDISSLQESFEREGQQILGDSKGYLQAVDSDGLMALAAERDMVLWLKQRPGDFIVRGGCLALAWPCGSLDEAAAKQVNRSIILGNQRTLEQDVLFAFKLLTEIAVRAISPAINDPFTAESCIDELSSGLCQMAGRVIPSPYRYDDKGRLRVIAAPFSFDDALKASFNTIRQHAESNATVTIYLMQSLEVVARQTRRQEDKTAVQRQAEVIFRSSQDNLSEESDRRDVEERYRRVLAALSQKPTAQGHSLWHKAVSA
jgi:uncharacterized membrane protein